MIPAYKLRFSSLSAKDIQRSASELSEFMSDMQSLMPKVNEKFDQMKSLAPELGKLQVQVAKLIEYNPKLQDLYHEKNELSEDLNHKVSELIFSLFNKLDKSVVFLKNITFDADTLLYRENKVLDKFAKKIRSLNADEKLSHELLSRINLVKEDMKQIARKLFQASKGEIPSVSEPSQPRISIVEQIKILGTAVDEVGRILVNLNIDDIEDVVRTSEDLLTDLKKIELEAQMVFSQLERYYDILKNKTYLLDKPTEERVSEKLSSSEEKFTKAKLSIAKNAEYLLKDIVIVEHIPSVS